MKFWEPIQGKLTKLDEEKITIDNTSYPITDEARDVVKHLEIGDVVNIVRNKEGQVMSIGKVTFNAAKIMEEANNAAKPPAVISSTNRMIIRQNALAHADAWVRLLFDKKDLMAGKSTGEIAERIQDVRQEYFEFAEKVERWITR